MGASYKFFGAMFTFIYCSIVDFGYMILKYCFVGTADGTLCTSNTTGTLCMIILNMRLVACFEPELFITFIASVLGLKIKKKTSLPTVEVKLCILVCV